MIICPQKTVNRQTACAIVYFFETRYYYNMKKTAFITYYILLLFIFLPVCGQTQAEQTDSPPEIHSMNPESSGAFQNSSEHTDSIYYTVNDYYNMASNGSLHIISHYETYQQTTAYSCGPAAALMVLNHFGISGYSEMEIGKLVGTDPEKGTAVEGLRRFLESLGFQLEYHESTKPRFDNILECEEYLIRAIDSNVPVLVEWVDWYGHWQTIIGLDTCGTENIYDDVLIMADSYDLTDHYQDGYYVVPFARFFCMWRESPFVDREVTYEQPFIAVYGM